MKKNKKVVLAYSGGLDTSVAVRWLADKGYDVIAYMVDVGQGSNFQKLKKRALSAGASKAIVHDLKDEFVTSFVFQSLKADAVYESKYLLTTALSRPLIAKGLVDVAKKENASAVAHGCTGKGNDQVRFEVTITSLAPHLEIIAPLREWNMFSRDEEIEYAMEKNIDIDRRIIERQEDASDAIAKIIVGFPVYLYHWSVITRDRKRRKDDI